MLSVLCIGLVLPGSATLAQHDAEVAPVRKIFAALQPVSIRENREYCGYVGFDRAGMLSASRAIAGTTGTCLPDDPVLLALITASNHTHGAFSPEHLNEIPSGDDMEDDEAEGIEGDVVTPGGRLWYLDTTDMFASQLCGIGCLPRETKFIDGADGIVAQSYSYDDLVRKLAE